MNVKDPIRKRLNKGFLVISIVCCIGLVISDIALFAMSQVIIMQWLIMAFHRARLEKQ